MLDQVKGPQRLCLVACDYFFLLGCRSFLLSNNHPPPGHIHGPQRVEVQPANNRQQYGYIASNNFLFNLRDASTASAWAFCAFQILAAIQAI